MPQSNNNDDLLKKVGDLIDQKLGEQQRKQDSARKRREDPWGALSDLIDERIKAARDADTEDEGESNPRPRRGRQEPDEGGFFAQIIGGQK